MVAGELSKGQRHDETGAGPKLSGSARSACKRSNSPAASALRVRSRDGLGRVAHGENNLSACLSYFAGDKRRNVSRRAKDDGGDGSHGTKDETAVFSQLWEC